MVIEDERPVDRTVKPEGWFGSLNDFDAMAKKDYAEKHENADVTANAETTADGAVQVTITDQNGEVLDVYTIDPKTGTGTNQNAEEVNLPQTGVTSKSTAAAVGGALAMMAAGLWAMVRSLRKKKDE